MAAPRRIRNGRGKGGSADFLPVVLRHHGVEARQDDGTIGHFRDGGDEPRCRRYRTGGARDDHGTAPGQACEPPRLGVEQRRRVAGRGRAPQFAKPRRPPFGSDLQEFQCQLPPVRIVLDLEMVEIGPVSLLGFNGVDQFGEIASEPDSVRRACRRNQRRAGMQRPDRFRQTVAPRQNESRQFQKTSRTGQWFGEIDECRGRLVEEARFLLRFTEWSDNRQNGGAPAKQIDEFRAQRSRRAPRRHEDRHSRQRQRIGGVIGEIRRQRSIT